MLTHKNHLHNIPIGVGAVKAAGAVAVIFWWRFDHHLMCGKVIMPFIDCFPGREKKADMIASLVFIGLKVFGGTVEGEIVCI